MVQVSTAALRAQLLDESLPLPLRFRILFSLKAVNTVEAVEALLAGTLCWRAALLALAHHLA